MAKSTMRTKRAALAAGPSPSMARRKRQVDGNDPDESLSGMQLGRAVCMLARCFVYLVHHMSEQRWARALSKLGMYANHYLFTLPGAARVPSDE